jgi:hypothetical protein
MDKTLGFEDSWQCYKSVTETNEYMLKKQIATDVTFLVYKSNNKDSSFSSSSSCKETPTIFKAHKYVLFSRSPVFQAMFLGEMAEKGDVTIED